MSELIIPILFIVLSIVAKSFEDRRKIEKKRKKRKINIPTIPDSSKTEIEENEYDEPMTVTFEEAEVFPEDDEEDKADRYYESIFEDLEEFYGKSHNIEVEVIGEMDSEYEYDVEDIKEDILKGIIFSEILSQPKSIKRRKM